MQHCRHRPSRATLARHKVVDQMKLLRFPRRQADRSAWRPVWGVAGYRYRLGMVFGRRRFVAEFPATLVRDPSTVDPTAVAVRIRGVVAGHLPPEDAAQLTPLLVDAQTRGIAARVTAQVRYDWADDERSPQVAVWLRLAGASAPAG
jgi:hypothetical protein